MKPYISNGNFPRYRNIRVFDGLLSPDTLHFFKHVKGFDKFNHLNIDTHSQGVDKCERFYGKLKKRTKKCRHHYFAISWFAHFLVDCLDIASAALTILLHINNLSAFEIYPLLKYRTT